MEAYNIATVHTRTQEQHRDKLNEKKNKWIEAARNQKIETQRNGIVENALKCKRISVFEHHLTDICAAGVPFCFFFIYIFFISVPLCLFVHNNFVAGNVFFYLVLFQYINIPCLYSSSFL